MTGRRPSTLHLLPAGVVLAGLLLARTAGAQVTIQPVASSGSVQFDSSGNVVTAGHCFGNVSPLPSGGAVTFVGGQVVSVGGDIFFAGPLNFASATFSGAVVIRVGANAVASIGADGSLNAAGTCFPTSGYSNTQYEPSLWNNPANNLKDNNNCYIYATDMKFTDGVFRFPGKKTCGGFTAAMYLHSYSHYNPDDGTTASDVGLVERVEADGLTPVGNIYPAAPITWPGNNYSCPNRGHLILMLYSPNGSYPSTVADDYHFLRLDQKDGAWSQKDLWSPITNLGMDNQPIINPLTPEALAGWIPVGFFCGPGGHIDMN